LGVFHHFFTGFFLFLRAAPRDSSFWGFTLFLGVNPFFGIFWAAFFSLTFFGPLLLFLGDHFFGTLWITHPGLGGKFLALFFNPFFFPDIPLPRFLGLNDGGALSPFGDIVFPFGLTTGFLGGPYTPFLEGPFVFV